MSARPLRKEPMARPCCSGRNAEPAALAQAKPTPIPQPKEQRS